MTTQVNWTHASTGNLPSLLGKLVLALVCTLATSLSTTVPSHGEITRVSVAADIVVASYIPKSGSTLAPFPLISFCRRNAAACVGGSDHLIEFTADLRRLLTTVNLSVNRRIRPMSDGKDVWSLDPTAGDCEDYAISKRYHLIEAGVPAGALRLAVARTRSGEGHAVLLVRTRQGDFVLDNRNGKIMPWQATDLTFVSVATAENPKIWDRVGTAIASNGN